MQPDRDTRIQNAVELTLIPGIGIRTRSKILGRIPDITDLFAMGDAAVRAAGIPEETIPAIRSRAYRSAAEEITNWADREGCRILVHGRGKYPPLLQQIDDAPLVLYTFGDLRHLDRPRIAIVGSRRPTVYGLQMAQGLASDLGEKGLCIVSGLARGIDAAAHRGCLERGGSTVAVLGSGIDITYPPEHRHLRSEIAQSGMVVSEFPPGTVPSPHNFPIRNRIISGLSLGSVVIEAGERSGSLITARLALEQNREVFAVPGNITSAASYGPNFLIKQGAKLVQSWKDVVEELPASIRNDIFQKEEKDRRLPPTLNLAPNGVKKLLSCMKLDEATHFDALYHACNLNITDLSEQLLNLEMEGLIRRLPGDMYILSARVPNK
jgi:DNA processing protein